MYQVTKTYGHELGLSCCFRQWRAESHCAQLHGYALSFKFIFEANGLNELNWVVDFGGLKALKKQLVDFFDHTLLIAEDDPMLDHLALLGGLGLARTIVFPRVGCEAFAKIAYDFAYQTLKNMQEIPRVRVVSCEVSEHGANSATYAPPRSEFGSFGVR